MNQDTSTVTVCPLCGSITHESIIKLQEPNSYHDIRQCLKCKNAWTCPAPCLIDYESRNFHRQSIATSSPAVMKSISNLPSEWKKSIKKQVSLIEHYLKPGNKVLEIGCGEGILLSELTNSGFIVEGIEPSLDASSRARSKGLKVTTSQFPAYIPDDIFDLVILSHVLEHIANPSLFLKEVIRLIPNSYLLLIQTNYCGIIPRIRPKEWYAWVPNEHYWHFTPSGINYLLNKMDLILIKCEYSSLVHTRKRDKLIRSITTLLPQLSDQFHALFRLA